MKIITKSNKTKIVALIILALLASLLGEVKAKQEVFEIRISGKINQIKNYQLPIPANRLSEAEILASKLAEESRLRENQDLNKLISAGYKTEYYHLYKQAGEKYGVDWQILAALHKIESGQQGTTSVKSYAGAIGPMQFMPRTFKAYGVDGNADGQIIITDVSDAVFSAANYVSANQKIGGLDKALFQYNRSKVYVAKVKQMASWLY